MRKIRKRMVTVCIVITAGLLLLAGRLADLQLFNTEHFGRHHINLIEESVQQRTQSVLINNGRGSMLDRNGTSLSGGDEPSLVLFPFIRGLDWPGKEISRITGMSEGILISLVSRADEPLILAKKDGAELTPNDLDQINSLKFPGIYGVMVQTSSAERPAPHLTGFTAEMPEVMKTRYPEKKLPVNTKIGASGLQKAFDEFLLPESETRLLYHVDGNGNPLFGVNVKYIADSSSHYPVQIKTTIDEENQRVMEEILSSSPIQKGGAVLLDIQSNGILAMASKPELDPNGDGSGMKNYMLESMKPGSVFKIVTAAAAIESGLDHPSARYNCDLNPYGAPEEDRQLGTLDFDKSFSRSCNYTYNILSNELIKKDPDYLEKTAANLGLLEPAGWSGPVFHYSLFKQLPEEKGGTVWKDERDKGSKKAVAQAAIGQKDVQATPLAIANMMASIARGGEKMTVKAVEEILYKNGTVMYRFPDQEQPGPSIDRYTVQKLQKLLRLVVEDEKGTGSKFRSLPFLTAGKSGTAETGKKDVSGQNLINKWFAGYFPSDNPKYALVVLDADTVASRASANQVFYDLAAAIGSGS
ncbi:penicillin-binding protein 2 [Bacillus mangrovi]|uniref:Penicillin-binding protein 2 n=1 Tax=Metabacillus mangrovi TaxID=1491830 RepID=A0A7X2S2J5_9BACI|nr:penicillin-binding transpeptidase domain-containing protein [Metabacillus mangrovi]MTH52517.1 penicillin-binding protein 2 [Metabacillus mangrovi]